MTTTPARLPDGFEVRIREDVTRLANGHVLVGGTPLRALRLTDAATALIEHDRIRVVDPASAALARRLLDANIADPVLSAAVPNHVLTVIIPVRDRPEQLDRALSALYPLPVVVVDDASTDPETVAQTAARHDAHLITLQLNQGPAGARNAGLAHVTTPYVAFVDSDVEITADALLRLTRHFTDPCVAMVGPRIIGIARTTRPRWHERYDESASSLDLGDRPCSVQPGATVAWIPSACLLARISQLGDGFDPDLRIGEDVDLVWRLTTSGHTIRYDPTITAQHDTRPTLTGWLERKFAYGTGGATLAQRHGTHTAVARLSPAMALAATALLTRHRYSIPIAVVCLAYSTGSLARSLPDAVRGTGLANRLAIRGLGWSLRQESALLLRHWWPATLLAALTNRTARRALTTAAIIDLITAKPGSNQNPLNTFLGRRIDDLAYGAGLWWGAINIRSPKTLAIRWIRVRQKPNLHAGLSARGNCPSRAVSAHGVSYRL
ncbi:mycofactocin biosynthesis glycosyltransferase MftF [Sciscionella marina]|uniref:mycofactocin biosynthesis glycosyltransferase MftF n=1 Tax=Sciscionella marina TaxID=508770 RepID=UPI0012F6ECC1|nr:mycofactocin biosynthesis glycosyltransferase MftF [Sciscionella marina]